ncbi:hypothetical protein SEUCBS139899_005862 [Sporothrix eucalyptigena]|uniref:C3H1-type domain-containing protein n=1 Tax=Sporothrix eucalyptigena TaxID=1812306 RepID=A0ABP0D179_9PEZI
MTTHRQQTKLKYYTDHSTVRCKYGSGCWYLRRKICEFYHPPEDTDKSAQSAFSYRERLAKGRERFQLMTKDLSDSVVLAGPQGSNGQVDDVVDDDHSEPVRITGERVLASFNRIDDNIIAVPGCPPKFVPPIDTLKINNSQDQRRVFPTYTFGLEPLVRAVQCMAPDFDVLGGTCDLVANAGSLYRMFNFLANKSFITIRADLEWRPCENGRGTLLMQQWKSDPDHQVSYGYGESFSTATCQFSPNLPDPLPSSFTHHRVLYYELGGLRFAVHCEADGYYDPGETSPETQKAQKVQLPPSPPVSPKLHMLTPISTGSRFSVLMDDGCSSSSVSSPTLSIKYPCGPDVPIPDEHLVEIKTYDARKLRNWKRRESLGKYNNYPYVRYKPDSQLYFGRIQQLYETGHEVGLFPSNVAVDNVTARLQEWEVEHQDDLRRLVQFVQRLCTLAAASAARGHSRMSLVLPGTQDTATARNRAAKLYVRNDDVSLLPEVL